MTVAGQQKQHQHNFHRVNCTLSLITIYALVI
jgi:hypothetical protein